MNLLEEIYKRKIIPICKDIDYFINDNPEKRKEKYRHFDPESTKKILYGLFCSYNSLSYATKEGLELKNKILQTLNIILNRKNLLSKIYFSNDEDFGSCCITISPRQLYINVPQKVIEKTDKTIFQVIDYIASYSVGLFLVFLDEKGDEIIISDKNFINELIKMGVKEN